MNSLRVAFRIESRPLCALVVLLLACTVLTWIGVQAIFAVPAADDFCYGSRAMREGVFKAVVNEYFKWGGRYTSTFLMSWFSSSKSLLTQYYFIGPAVILATNLFATRYLLATIDIRSRWFVIVFFAVLISSYSLRESVFWVPGGITYGLGSALFISIIAAELSLVTHGSPPTVSRVATVAFATLVLAGFNETIMVAHVTLLLCLFILCTIFDKNLCRAIGILLSAAIVGASVVALAPGNSIRATFFPHPQFLLSLASSLYWVIKTYFMFSVVTTLLLICALIIFVPKSEELERGQAIAPIYIWASLLGALWASAFTRFYSLGSQGPPRASTVDYAITTLLCLLIAWDLYKRLLRHNSHRRFSPVSLVFLTCGFATALLLRPVPDRLRLTSALDNIQHAFQLNRYMSNRLESLPNDGGEAMDISDYEDKHQAITFFADITSDRNDWKNACFARYFNLKQVSLTNQLGSGLIQTQNAMMAARTTADRKLIASLS